MNYLQLITINLFLGMILGALLMRGWIRFLMTRATSDDPNTSLRAVKKLAQEGLGLAFLRAVRVAMGRG